MAMESRGFQDDAPRAIAFRVNVHPTDFLFLFGLNGLIILGLIFLK